MDEFGLNEPFEVDFEHYCHIANEKMLHIVVGLTFVFFPYEVSDESLYDETILTYFF